MYDLRSIHSRLQDRESQLFRTEQESVRCFYEKLERLESGSDPLFRMWQNELEFTYGGLDELLAQNSKVRPDELSALYGFDAAQGVDLSQLLKSIQTFYSVLIKFITFNMVRGTAPSPEREADGGGIKAVLSGQAFLDLGICNYCYEDWFSWILKYWDPSLERQCHKLWVCLETENTVASLQDFARNFRADSLKHIYETVIPKEIRHALGEYYTPDWLAACVVNNALRRREQPVTDLRFIDPTCGAGTFLTQVMRLAREGSAGGPVRPSIAAGFDINSLAVLTAKANFLGTILDQSGAYSRFIIPIYHYDVINIPQVKGEYLAVDTNCDLVCEVPLSVCEKVVQKSGGLGGEELLQLLQQSSGCAALWERLSAYDRFNQRVIANILLNRIFAFYEKRADIVVGNPPWVNWEYLPLKYRSKSQHLWPEYGLFRAKGRELSFSKEDISVLITYVVIDRFLKENGHLSFVLRQAMFKSAQNGAGFRHFKLEQSGTEFSVLQVDDLCGIKPFEGVSGQSALVLIQKNVKQRFPVPYRCWARKKHFLKAVREPGATADSVMPFVEIKEMIAFPADRHDPTSIWINTPEEIVPVIGLLLGSNQYKARTGAFTGGANAVYWMKVLEGDGRTVRVSNLVERAKRKVKAVTAEIEPAFVYPLVQGSDISQWQVSTKSYILFPHTPETKMYPVEERVLRAEAPKTLAYLTAFRDDLDARKGFAGWEKEIQRQHFYALLRIGAYTFAKYKVAWRYIARSFITAVITCAQDPFVGEKLYIPNEKIMYVGTDCKDEAFYLCGVLSSSPVSYCVRCYMNPTSISAHVLDKLNIPRYDPGNALHREIARICEAGHRTEDPDQRARLQFDLDAAIGTLYGIPPVSVRMIRDILQEM